MGSNWIILDDGMDGTGSPVNLDFGMKVIYGGNYPAPSDDQKKMVTLIHGIPGSATVKGSTTAMKYASANLALAAFNRLINLMKALGYIGPNSDLRTQSVSITAILPVSAVHDVATPIVVSGNGFKGTGKITIGGVDCPITVSGAGIAFTTPVSLMAGAYDVEYTDPEGNAAVLTGGLTLT